MKKTFALLLLLTVAACGGGGSDDSFCGLFSPGPAPPASSVQNDPACSAAPPTCGGTCPKAGLDCKFIETTSGNKCWFYSEYVCRTNDSQASDGGASDAGAGTPPVWECLLP